MNRFGFKIVMTTAVTIATLALALCSGLFPSFSLLFGLLMSVFVSSLYISCGGICFLISAVLTAGSVLLINQGQPYLLIIVAFGFIPGLILGFSVKHRFGYYEALGGSSLAFGAMIILTLYLATMTFKGGLGGFFDALTSDMKTLAAQSVSEYKMEGLNAEDINAVIEELMRLIRRSIPGLVVMISLILGYIHTALTEFSVKKITSISPDYVKLDAHKAPKSLVYIFLILSVIYLFGSDKGAFWAVIQNVVSVLEFILAFCGFSFIESKFKATVKIGIIRIIVYIVALILSGGFAVQILSIVGMFDGLRDYRRIKER